MIKIDPSLTSGDYDAMKPYWIMVDTILAGADAMRAAQETFLPKFPNESAADYTFRANNAKFTNIYGDIVGGLASKPFSEVCSVEDDASEQIKALGEDIDGRGNNLHVFASELFFAGINHAVSWVLVDYTKLKQREDGRPLTEADVKAQNARPYWVHIPATSLLAVYSDKINGKEAITHARLRENIVRRDVFTEVTVERIRVFDREPILGEGGRVSGYGPAKWELWERESKDEWKVVDSGLVSIGVIPLVPFITGRRVGGSWVFVPPMQDVANLQVEHYQQETNLKAIKEQAAFPMLAGNGISPRIDKDGNIQPVPVGPKSVLYAPMNPETGQKGEWNYVQPEADILEFLAKDVKATEEQMREIGRQPVTATAGITVVAAAFASQKASSACQAWAWKLKDCLEQAWVLTTAWMKVQEQVSVSVFTDFAIEQGDQQGPTVLTEARKNGDISRPTYWEELQRRGVLSANFDPDAEDERLVKERDEQIEEDDMAAARMIEIKKQTQPAADPAAQQDPQQAAA